MPQSSQIFYGNHSKFGKKVEFGKKYKDHISHVTCISHLFALCTVCIEVSVLLLRRTSSKGSETITHIKFLARGCRG